MEQLPVSVDWKSVAGAEEGRMVLDSRTAHVSRFPVYPLNWASNNKLLHVASRGGRAHSCTQSCHNSTSAACHVAIFLRHKHAFPLGRPNDQTRHCTVLPWLSPLSPLCRLPGKLDVNGENRSVIQETGKVMAVVAPAPSSTTFKVSSIFPLPFYPSFIYSWV